MKIETLDTLKEEITRYCFSAGSALNGESKSCTEAIFIETLGPLLDKYLTNCNEQPCRHCSKNN